MSGRLRPIVIAAFVGAGVLLPVAVVGLINYARAVSTWSGDRAFAADVADAAAEALASAMTDALARADKELAEIRVDGKTFTLEDLTRMRDLYQAGEHERLKQELRSSYTDQQLRELARKLDRVAKHLQQPAPASGP